MAKYFKQGDTLPTITDTLLDSTGTACNVSGATVYFLARIAGQSEPRIAASATIVSGASGQVSYPFTSTDLALAGTYEYEWEVQDSSGTYTVPTATWGSMTIYDDVGKGGLTSTHASGTITVTHASLDTGGSALGNAPPTAKMYAFLGTQPVAVAVVDSSGHYTLTLVDDLTYSLQVQYPGYTSAIKTVNT